MAAKGVQAQVADVPQTIVDEALATWQTLIQAAWNLTNVRVGCKDVVPRFTGVPASLETLRARVADVRRLQTLDLIEDEMHTARADLAEIQQLLQATERSVDEILREVWNRKKTIRNPAHE